MTNNKHSSRSNTSSYETVRVGLIIALVIALFLIVGHIESHYDKVATVEYVNPNSYVTAIDKQGNVWGFYADNLCEGDIVKLKMFTNCTDSICDDEVVGVKKM